MAALFSISLWFALVTVVPGLVTVAAVYGAFAAVDRGQLELASLAEAAPNDLVWVAVAIAAMVLTQAVGIILEERVLAPKELLGGRRGIEVQSEQGTERINPYDVYKRLYIELADMKDHEDPRGHVERAVAQFFLSLNTLVSFAAGIVAALALLAAEPTREAAIAATIYVAALLAALAVTYAVVVSRFGIVAKSMWAAGRVRPQTAPPQR